MTEDKRIVWTNIDLDPEDWQGQAVPSTDLHGNYPCGVGIVL